MSDKQPSNNRAWAYASEGMQLAVTLLLGIFVGYKLDQKWDSMPWCTLTGAGVGFLLGIYQFLKRFLKP
jgi:F0F1-type ATP synthase assembly protein I